MTLMHLVKTLLTAVVIVVVSEVAKGSPGMGGRWITPINPLIMLAA